MRSRIYRALSFFIGALISPVKTQNLRNVTSHSKILAPSSVADASPPSQEHVRSAVSVEHSSVTDASMINPSGLGPSTGAPRPRDIANVDKSVLASAPLAERVSSVGTQETIHYAVNGKSLQMKRIHDARHVYHVKVLDTKFAPPASANRGLQDILVTNDTEVFEIDGMGGPSDVVPKKQSRHPKGLTKLARRRELWDAFVDWIEDAGDAIVDFGETFADHLEDVGEAFEGLGEELASGLEDFADAVENAGDVIVGVAEDAGEAIVVAANEIVFVAEGMWRAHVDLLIQVATAVGEALIYLYEKALEFAQCLAGKAVAGGVDVEFADSEADCPGKFIDQVVKCLSPDGTPCIIETRDTSDHPGDCGILLTVTFPLFSYEAVIERSRESDNGSANAELSASVEVEATVGGELDLAVYFNKPPLPLADSSEDSSERVRDHIFMGITSTVEVVASFTLSSSGTAEYSSEIELAQKRNLFRKVFMAAFVPVLVEIDVQPMLWIDASAEANAELSLEVSTSLTASLDVEFDIVRLAFEAEESVEGVAPHISGFDVSGSMSMTSYGRVGVRFHFSVMSYTVHVDAALAIGFSMNLEAQASPSGSCLAGSVAANFGLEARVIFENPFDFIGGFFAGACETTMAMLGTALGPMNCILEGFGAEPIDLTELSDVCDELEFDVSELLGLNCDPMALIEDPGDDWHTIIGFDVELPRSLPGVDICDDVFECEVPSIDVTQTELASRIAECFGLGDAAEGLTVQSSEFGCPDAPEAVQAVLTKNFLPVQADTCVSGENIRRVYTESPEACAQECVNHGSSCVGIEFFRARGMCHLSSSTDTSGCDAVSATRNEECPRHDITRYYGWSHLSYQGYFTPVDLGKWSDDGLWFRWNSQNPIDVKVCNYGDHTPVYEGSILPLCCSDRVSRTDPPSGILHIPDEGYYVVRADCDCGSSIDFYPRKSPGTVSTPSGFFPVQENTCVSGENIKRFYDTTPEACARECIAHGSSCVGIEFYRESHICHLSSGTDTAGCGGATYRINFFERKGANDPGYVASPPKGFYVQQDVCVSDHNLRLLKNMSPETCASECEEYGSSCVGFEFCHTDGPYDKNDCILASSTNTDGCNGIHYKMDFYKRQFLNTPNNETALYPLHDGLDSEQFGNFAFDVRARHDAIIVLQTQNIVGYTIVLGANDDDRSVIQCGSDMTAAASVARQDGTHLSRDAFRGFQISWDSRTVWVSRLTSSGWEYMMGFLRSDCDNSFDRVKVATGRGSKGKWARSSSAPQGFFPALRDSCVFDNDLGSTLYGTTPERCARSCVLYDTCVGIDFDYEDNSCKYQGSTNVAVGDCADYETDHYRRVRLPRIPLAAPAGFQPPQADSCVSGKNIGTTILNTTPQACARACIAADGGHSCVGIEFFYETTGSYAANSCNLSRGAETIPCPTYKVDFYERTAASPPTGFRPPRRDRCYSGGNIREIPNTTPSFCARECRELQYECVGFEFFYQATSSYGQNDCVLTWRSEAYGFNEIDCEDYRVDFYERIMPSQPLPAYYEAPLRESCVWGHNIYKWSNTNPNDCATLCSALSGCVGIEFYYASSAHYDRNDCTLSSSASVDRGGCTDYHVDFYRKITD